MKCENIYRIIALFSYFLFFPVLIRIHIVKFSKLKLWKNEISTPSNKFDKLELNINYLRNKYYTLVFSNDASDRFNLSKCPKIGHFIEVYDHWVLLSRPESLSKSELFTEALRNSFFNMDISTGIDNLCEKYCSCMDNLFAQNTSFILFLIIMFAGEKSSCATS